MSPITWFAIYMIIWWTVLFAVLPLGSRSFFEAGIKPPPGVDPGAVTAKPIATAPKVETRPLDAKPPVGSASAASAVAAKDAPKEPPKEAPKDTAADDDTLSWTWPVSQPVSAGFDEQRNKGLDFAGKPGDPIVAVADGRVVYAGSGLRGYGNLVIIKHNNTYLTAYAHNRAMFVEQDQVDRKSVV